MKGAGIDCPCKGLLSESMFEHGSARSKERGLSQWKPRHCILCGIPIHRGDCIICLLLVFAPPPSALAVVCVDANLGVSLNEGASEMRGLHLKLYGRNHSPNSFASVRHLRGGAGALLAFRLEGAGHGAGAAGPQGRGRGAPGKTCVSVSAGFPSRAKRGCPVFLMAGLLSHPSPSTEHLLGISSPKPSSEHVFFPHLGR